MTNHKAWIPAFAAAALAARLLACSSSDSTSPVATGGGTTPAGGTGGTGDGGGGGGASGGGASGCDASGKGGAPSPTCLPSQKGAVVSYPVTDACGQSMRSHTCEGSCIFQSGSSVSCVPTAVGQAPFRTCITAADCGTSSYCVDGTHAKLLDSPVCNDGVCDWSSAQTETCTPKVSVCSAATGHCLFQGQAGSTSGSFPSSMKGICNGDEMVGFGISNFTPPPKMFSFSYFCKNGCVEDATGAGCLPAVDDLPLHTCSSASDCPLEPSGCTSTEPGKKSTWSGPTCPAGLCSWTSSVTSDCPSGTTCTGKPCGE